MVLAHLQYQGLQFVSLTSYFTFPPGKMPTGTLQELCPRCAYGCGPVWHRVWTVADMEMHHPDLLSRNDFPLSCGDCQRVASSCQNLLGCSAAENFLIRGHTFSPEQPSSLTKQSRNIKAQPLQSNTTLSERHYSHSRASCIIIHLLPLLSCDKHLVPKLCLQ